jgi:multimeric flavodoxin WrbA
LKDLTIHHFSLEDYQLGKTIDDDFQKIEDGIKQSDAVVIASPIWNFSVPAHLKNVIDRMGSFSLGENRTMGTLEGKPFFFLYTGGSPAPAWPALMRGTLRHMKISIQYFGGSVVGMDYEGRCTQGKGRFGLVVHERPESIARMKKKGAGYATQIDRFLRTGILPLRYRMSVKIFAWGQRLIRKIV